MSVVRLRPLVVAADDEPDAVRLVELCLNRADIAVLTAPDGERALELIRAESPDACVLDVAMPRLGGLGVIRQMRADEATRTLPVVLLTAAARPTDAISGREANFFSSHSMVGSMGREYIHDKSPRANMFLARCASFLETPVDLTASVVMDVMGT